MVEDWDLAEIARYIDWTPFFQTWEMKGVYPRLLDDPKQGEAARALFLISSSAKSRIDGSSSSRTSRALTIAPTGLITSWHTREQSRAERSSASRFTVVMARSGRFG